MFMGCCCAGGDCGPCCRDRGCISEFVEARITGVASTGAGYTCEGDCTDLFADWKTLTASTSDYFEGQCLWESGAVEPVGCGADATSVVPGQWPFKTTSSFTLGFARKRLECTGSILPQTTCWLTAILTGDSTTSGMPNSGPFTVLFEAEVPGPYPTDCEGIWSLAYKCGTGFVGCDWTLATVEVNFVFNGACDVTATFDPWNDDVDWLIESACVDIDGDTDTLTNVSSETTQQWSKTDLGILGILDVDASLVWNESLCAYRLTLTQGGATSCRLIGGTQTVTGTIVSCDPFELLFEGFGLEDDPINGPCECGDPSSFDVRITEP